MLAHLKLKSDTTQHWNLMLKIFIHHKIIFSCKQKVTEKFPFNTANQFFIHNLHLEKIYNFFLFHCFNLAKSKKICTLRKYEKWFFFIFSKNFTVRNICFNYHLCSYAPEQASRFADKHVYEFRILFCNLTKPSPSSSPRSPEIRHMAAGEKNLLHDQLIDHLRTCSRYFAISHLFDVHFAIAFHDR